MYFYAPRDHKVLDFGKKMKGKAGRQAAICYARLQHVFDLLGFTPLTTLFVGHYRRPKLLSHSYGWRNDHRPQPVEVRPLREAISA